MRKVKITGVILATLIAATAGVFTVEAIDTAEELSKATHCTFAIPPEFVPGGKKGLFINKNHPMESSSIKYSQYDNGGDVVLTNRERLELEASGEEIVVDETINLTKDTYEETISHAYNIEYGENVGYSVRSFDKISVDGYPGFKIVAQYQPANSEVIHQTVYMLISKYRVFTVTYQRADDDDCEETFLESAATIHIF